jgi:hypothetical protein
MIAMRTAVMLWAMLKVRWHPIACFHHHNTAMAFWAPSVLVRVLRNPIGARDFTPNLLAVLKSHNLTLQISPVFSHADFLPRFFALERLSLASFFSKSAFEIVSTMRRALLSRSDGVLPGTFGAGNGFIPFSW